MRPIARRFRRWGYRTANSDYAPGPAGLTDVLALYDELRAQRPDDRVCVYGESAGGHWALLLAALRPDVNCVIALAAPVDLVDPALGGVLDTIIGQVFGAARSSYSPLSIAGWIQAPVLLAYGLDDAVVPVEQGQRMHAALAGSKLVLMAPGATAWVHGTSSTRALRRLNARERSWLDGS